MVYVHTLPQTCDPSYSNNMWPTLELDISKYITFGLVYVTKMEHFMLCIAHMSRFVKFWVWLWIHLEGKMHLRMVASDNLATASSHITIQNSTILNMWQLMMLLLLTWDIYIKEFDPWRSYSPLAFLLKIDGDLVNPCLTHTWRHPCLTHT